jgi:tetratricopeptide (TPR) repeat protein
MLVLPVVEEVRGNEDLAARWYPLVFSEESYLVRTPGEFWLEALFHLAHKTDDERWRRTYEELRDEQDEERLRERALAQLMDFADREGKRILLVVENFNMLLGEQMSEGDAWKLRHTLQHEARVMLLATATPYFRWEKRGALGPEMKNWGRAMFELFKLHELKPLDEEECGKLWNSVSGKEASDERVRPLQILTGGNPRLLAIISSFAGKMSLKELMDDLMELVDDNTEYFKSHLDSLPAVERRVYLALAELWDPVPAGKVAEVARLGVSKTSSLLKRLMERGVVVQANGERRRKLYEVCERMYNIYYLMRRCGGPSRRVKALVRFMVPFYGEEELVSLTQRIAEEACKLTPELRGEHLLAYKALVESAVDVSVREKLIKVTPPQFFEMLDIPSSIKALIGKETAEGEKASCAEVAKVIEEAYEVLDKRGDREEAEGICRRLIEVAPGDGWAWAARGVVMTVVLGRDEEAEEAFRKAIELKPESGLPH